MKQVSHKILLLTGCVVLLSFIMSGPVKVHVYLVGDSTMANKPLEDNPERGWGQLIPAFFSKKVVFENFAVNGRSTKSFIDEGRWDKVLAKLKDGDYVFIQFGHNDEKKEDPKRYAEAHTAYKDNLLKFVKEARSKGALPVLITPVMRRNFDDKGNFKDTHGDYPAVVKMVGQDEHVPVIDLHNSSEKLIVSMGEEGSKSLFLHIAPGVYKSLPSGRNDNTHFSEFGARKIAALVVQGILEQNLSLKKYIKPEFFRKSKEAAESGE